MRFRPFTWLAIGIHFLPLAWVFGQPILAVVGVVLAVAAVVAALVPADAVARSFWCGGVAAPVLIAAGAWCAAAGAARRAVRDTRAMRMRRTDSARAPVRSAPD